MASLDQQLENARKREQLALSKMNAKRIENTYRALDDSHNKRKRHTPKIEFRGEDEELGSHGRLKSIAKARDTRRNYSGAKATENQIWLNVVGTGPKLIVHNEKIGQEYSDWFNTVFAKRCDGRGDLHLADQAKLVLTTVVREGDLLCYFDTEGIIPDAEGTLWYWEADQMPDLDDGSFRQVQKKIKRIIGYSGEITQSHGQIIDRWGRVLAYIVCKNHKSRGKTTAKFDEVTILPKENCRFIYNPWRLNQRRGTSDYLEIANMWQDLERFTEALIQRSIVQSYLALKVKKQGGAVEGRANIYDTENPDGIPDITSDEVSEGTNYRNFEKLAMNAIEYLDTDEDVEALQLAGDLPDAQNLIDYMQGNAGWAQGLSAMYSTGKADASYSASMAEANMSWAMFEWWQKFIERYFFDWVADMAFRWANKNGAVTQTRESEYASYSWHNLPRKRAINPSQEAMADRVNLEIGKINYEDILGPNWAAKLAKLGEQIKHGRDNGYFNPLFAPSGGRQ